MDVEPIISTMDPTRDSLTLWRIRDLLAQDGLGYDEDIELFVIARVGLNVVGCLGLAGNVLKCGAVAAAYRGHDLARKLMEEMNYVAVERGRNHLFLFTKPALRDVWGGCGFYPIAEVPKMVLLMENWPDGIARYGAELATRKVDGERIAGIVLNANPFTKGHRHLVQTATRECDHVHVFVVKENASLFSYDDRLALVRAGIAEISEAAKVTVHPGSAYIVSRATFPSYFLKEKADLNRAATGLDLQLFRRYVAPALGITHRYVGTEPFSAITNLYNNEMQRWLEHTEMDEPVIEVHIVDRVGLDQQTPVISATEVRRLLAAGELDRLRELVPGPTFELIQQKYAHQGEAHADHS